MRVMGNPNKDIAIHTRKKEEYFLTVFWILILCIYGVGIAFINFSQNPELYCTDMYSDMLYASEVWAQKTIFPDGWVFGNQLYAVATPVLAALMMGIVDNPCIAMGIASSLMGAGVLFSFSWMIKPMFPKIHERLAGAVVFMTILLLCGNVVHDVNGWQLFFTLCSYYSCYAITVFLAFGCFFRRHMAWSTKQYVIIIITCLLSFGTGVQSLRQTVIMIAPLIAVTLLEWFYCVITRKKYCHKSLLLVVALAISNFCGLLYANLVDVQKHEIFGEAMFATGDKIVVNAKTAMANMFSLFAEYKGIAFATVVMVLIYVIVTIFTKKDLQKNNLFICLLLCTISLLAILAIDILTMMYIRKIYYFLLFPVFSILVVYLYSYKRIFKGFVLLSMIIALLLSYNRDKDLYSELRNQDNVIENVTTFLEENDISVIYSQWDLGQKIAIESDFRIQAGFWDVPEDVFNSVKYLCNPSIFDADPDVCAYIISGEQNLDLAMEQAQNKGAKVEVIKYFEEMDIYVLSSDVMLMV